ncbi:MAG: type II secretion system protein GspM [Methylovulum sp.]|nr:type II secretion system protein GspM [Methylovulum sp.]
MINKLQQLSLRERMLLVGGVAVLLVSGLYAFAYMPIIEGQQRLSAAIATQQELTNLLQTISAEAAGLQGNKQEPAGDNSSQPSLMGLIDASSAPSGIKPAIQRLIPEGQDKVTLWLEHGEFDTLIGWLAMLDKQHAVTVQQIAISREPGDAGLVSGKLLLGKPAQ